MIRAPNVPTAEAQRERLRDAARSLEAMVLKQLVTASGAFTGGDGPGAAIRADMFAQTLADALSRGGGIGLAAQLERALGAEAAAPNPLSVRAGGVALPREGWSAPMTNSTRALARVDPGHVSQLNGSPARAPGAPCARGAVDLDRALLLPVDGRISSRFGVRADPFTGEHRHHGGVDFAAAEGSEIRAARPGRVIFSGPRGDYGNAVELDHGDGVTTLYAHASDLLVRRGDRVEAGQPIGRVGKTGRATGAHLHFEVRHDRRPQDPGRALNEYRVRADEEPGAGP